MLSGSYNIPYGYNFAEELAKGLWQAYGDKPEILAQSLVFLPTSRSCQAVKDAFLRITDGKASLMPRLIPLAEPEEDDVILALPDAPYIKPAIPPLKRQILLTQLISKTKGVQAKAEHEKISFDQALRISSSLSQLLDDCHAFEIPLKKIKQLTEGEYANHWEPILTFLDILFENWPLILEELDIQDAGARRAEILNLLSHAWVQNPPSYPIIAAAINRNIPSVQRFLKTLHHLPQSAVVFQGMEHIDDNLWTYFLNEERSWFEDSIAQSSPFWVNAQLLKHMELTPKNLAHWPCINEQSPPPQSMASQFMAQSLRPPHCQDKTEPNWPCDVFDNITLVECETSHDEAMVIAMMMRSQLENEGKTAALVTSDRSLAQKVRSQLRRWQLNINDSAGITLNQAPIGIYLNLTAQMIAENIRPRSLVAFLKHPFTRLGLSRDECRNLARHLDYYLRDLGNIQGFQLIMQHLQKKQDVLFGKGKQDEILDLIIAKLGELRLHMAPLTEKMSQYLTSAYELLYSHVEFCEWAATGHDNLGSDELWRQEAGESSSQLIRGLLQEFSGLPKINGTRWAEVFNIFLESKIIRPVKYSHPRLFIWGMVESRIQQADLTIIGGFNESHWPQIPETGPWLNRPMRKQIGMSGIEEEIGLNAADFMNLATAPQVMITRARKEGGSPSLQSRWLSRMEAHLKNHHLPSLREKSSPWLAWLSKLSKAEENPYLKLAHRPAPMPPLEARPKKLSVTRIEDLIKDSYSIYARKILNLYPLDKLEQDRGALEFGNLAHDIVEEFIAHMQQELGSDGTLDQEHFLQLKQLAMEKLQALHLPSHQEDFWKRRLMRLCEWFFAQESKSRHLIEKTYLEITGQYQFSVNDSYLTVTGKADRIDQLKDGRLRIIDYKTGSLPSIKSVVDGRSPQMTLEAIMAEKGGFSAFKAAPISQLEYWPISGKTSAKPPSPIKLDEEKYAHLLDDTENLLYTVIEYFDMSETPYFARPYGNKLKIFGQYDHLSRYGEWASSGDAMDD